MFDWSELAGAGGLNVGGGEAVGGALLWQRRTNINLLQQSIFHHTYSQGTSQSGLYPFCQWLPSSINFIENYTPDRCSSRPLSICRGASAEVVAGGGRARRRGGGAWASLRVLGSLTATFSFTHHPSHSPDGWLEGKENAITLIRPFIFYAPNNQHT